MCACDLQSMPGLAELTSPGFVSRSAAFAAVSYYTLAYVTQLLPVQAAAGLVISGLVSMTRHYADCTTTLAQHTQQLASAATTVLGMLGKSCPASDLLQLIRLFSNAL